MVKHFQEKKKKGPEKVQCLYICHEKLQASSYLSNEKKNQVTTQMAGFFFFFDERLPFSTHKA
jgi:hypothetical protein